MQKTIPPSAGEWFSTADGHWSNSSIRLEEHPTAREQALALRKFPPGTTVVRSTALAFVLTEKEKGQRCDACFRLAGPKSSLALRKCSGCAAYWYCGTECQKRQWNAFHKRMCKTINAYSTSGEFQALLPSERTDALLLAHLVAEHQPEVPAEIPPREDLNHSMTTFFNLLQTKATSRCPPIPILEKSKRITQDVLDHLYSRFGNNNFMVHSHLTSVGCGVFPLASRLFNHSCSPNAVVAYSFGRCGIEMHVRSIGDIRPGDEITIPYFDAALPYTTRQDICGNLYGFQCQCESCFIQASIKENQCEITGSARPDALQTVSALAASLRELAFVDVDQPTWPSKALQFSLPTELYAIFDERVLPQLSSTFTDAAHDAQYNIALDSGMTLLALYLTIYPPFYPQTGMHCLELAKTSWNAVVQQGNSYHDNSELRKAKRYLTMAKTSLSMLGEEGDVDDGPLREIETLQQLLDSSQ